MNRQQTFENFLVNQSVQVDLLSFGVNVALAALLAFLLGRLYVRYGDSLSDRSLFARNFVMIATTTVLIISVVKSSLALSLGLVGALSIVRFRAAIKEPEELAYLFLNIGIGLGLGADQRVVTVLAFLLIVVLIWLRRLGARASQTRSLYLSIDSHNPEKIPIGRVIDILGRHCRAVDLKRFDESGEQLDASFLVEFEDFSRLEAAKCELLAENRDVKVSFLDLKGITP
jgi:hypothetical protein